MNGIISQHDGTNLIEFVDSVLVNHTAFLKATNMLNDAMRRADNLREPLGFFIAGESRTGKSRVTEELCIHHPSFRTSEGLVSNIVRIIVPSRPTVKGLASEILQALEDPNAYKGTEQDMTRRILTLFRNCKVKMLILDEFQHFVDKTSKLSVLHHVSDWLKNLLSASKIVAVLVGLPYGQAVLSQNEQLRGRFTNTIHLSRFDWKIKAQRAEFLGLLDGFNQILSTKFCLPDLGNYEMGLRFYLASGGLTGYVFNIIRNSAWNAIDKGKSFITLDDFDIGYQIVVSAEDQQLKSPFSKAFDLEDGQAFEKATRVGLRAEEYFTNRK